MPSSITRGTAATLFNMSTQDNDSSLTSTLKSYCDRLSAMSKLIPPPAVGGPLGLVTERTAVPSPLTTEQLLSLSLAADGRQSLSSVLENFLSANGGARTQLQQRRAATVQQNEYDDEERGLSSECRLPTVPSPKRHCAASREYRTHDEDSSPSPSLRRDSGDAASFSAKLAPFLPLPAFLRNLGTTQTSQDAAMRETPPMQQGNITSDGTMNGQSTLLISCNNERTQSEQVFMCKVVAPLHDGQQIHIVTPNGAILTTTVFRFTGDEIPASAAAGGRPLLSAAAAQLPLANKLSACVAADLRAARDRNAANETRQRLLSSPPAVRIPKRFTPTTIFTSDESLAQQSPLSDPRSCSASRYSSSESSSSRESVITSQQRQQQFLNHVSHAILSSQTQNFGVGSGAFGHAYEYFAPQVQREISFDDDGLCGGQLQPDTTHLRSSSPTIRMLSALDGAHNSSSKQCKISTSVQRMATGEMSPKIFDGVNLDEIREFARQFKLKRLSLGLTQTQVGQALSMSEGPAYSQSAICRFEKLDITPKSAQKIKPVLEKWMKEIDEKYHLTLTDTAAMTATRSDEMNSRASTDDSPTLDMASKKRKRRTSFTPQALDYLNEYFEANMHPTGQEMSALAASLNYDREVVRVWFCNKRQALKNCQKTPTATSTTTVAR